MNDSSYILALFTVLFTLFVVLVERKLLAYAMRRVGPVLMGRNGAFQIGFDLVKLVTKETFLIPRPTTTLAPIFFSSDLLLSVNVLTNFYLRSLDVYFW